MGYGNIQTEVDIRDVVEEAAQGDQGDDFELFSDEFRDRLRDDHHQQEHLVKKYEAEGCKDGFKVAVPHFCTQGKAVGDKYDEDMCEECEDGQTQNDEFCLSYPFRSEQIVESLVCPY